MDQGRQGGGEADAALMPPVPGERGAAVAERDRLQLGEPVAAARAAEADRYLVTDELAATADEALVTAGTFLMWDLGLKHIQQTILATALTMTGMLAVLLPFPAFSGAGGRKCGDRDAVVNMLAAGLLTTAGFLAYFVALNNSTVSRIVPLVNTTPVFAVLILRFIFRRIEVVTAKTIIGATLTVLGVVLVVIG